MSMPDCIVVGGGVTGLLSAHFLTRAGMEVTLLEQGELAREATWAGGGIISPMYPWRFPDAVNVLAAYGQQHYPGFLEWLHAETGIDPQVRPSGMLMLDDAEPEMWDWARRWSARIEQIESRTGLDAVQPGLDDNFDRGLWMPEINQLRNPRLAKALAALAGKMPHLTVETHSPVTEVVVSQGRVSGVKSKGRSIHAPVVLVTAGAWSSDLMPRSCHAAIEIEPVKGQMILFAATPDLLTRMVMLESRYVIPRKDGMIVAGSTLEHTAFDKQTTQAALADLRQAAIGILPALKKLPVVHQWAGLRPGSPQGIPYISECPDVEGLFINAGQFRNGIVMGLGSALLGTQLITGETPLTDPSSYRL